MLPTDHPPDAALATHDWHVLSSEDVARALDSRLPDGLGSDEAARRLSELGPNELAEGKRTSPVVQFLAQFTSPLVLVLLAAAVISAVVHDWKDSVIIGIILFLNGVIGFVQEHRADRAMDALRNMTVPRTRVRRDGSVGEVAATELVPGDVCLLGAGDLVPADGRVVDSAELRISEAPLTGESEPVSKSADPLDTAETPLGDRRNMVYKGTSVVHGRGEVLITATGMGTELGRIAASLVSARKAETPLQRRLDRLGKALGASALGICAVLFVIGVLRGERVEDVLMTAIALAVAAIPEGLPAVLTVTLALGARRMAQRKAIVRSLPAVEGLGSVTTICSDKTGTLTLNQMTVTDVRAQGGQWQRKEGEGTAFVALPTGDARGHQPPEGLLLAAALCNDAAVDAGGSAVGDPTEVALLIAAGEAGVDVQALAAQYPRIGERPFTSATKWMSTAHRTKDGTLICAKGAPEAILPRCSTVLAPGGEAAIDEAAAQKVMRDVEGLASQGRRVLAIAERRLAVAEPGETDLEQGFALLGLVGIMDPPRPEAAAAIGECQSAGIRTVMITGDHAITARAIASSLGMVAPDAEVLTGADLDNLAAEALPDVAERVSVYARVSPEHKLQIVRALQSRGAVTAMTGDGINDAPALKSSDIGVSMGLKGTDVAREASDMVLADDNFATIVAAVREGRVIYDNLRKFIRFMLATNVAELLVIAGAMFAGMPSPLLPLQILWINLVTDGPPGLALGVEPAEPDVMQRRPRKPGESILGGGIMRGVLISSILMAGLVLALTSLGEDEASSRTIAFTSLALAQLTACISLRSLTQPWWRKGAFRNPSLWLAVAGGFAAQLAVVYLPPLQSLFKTVPLSAGDLGACVMVGVVVAAGIELDKWMGRRFLNAA
jgi:Ca2+-transporting ATPase